VWRATLDAPIDPRRDGALSTTERTRADRFLTPRDRLRFRRGRGLLRAILGRYLDEDPARLEFEYGPRGKPELAGARLRFNLSHSRDLLLVAVTAKSRVGVDVDQVRPVADLDRIARRFFSAAENAALASVPPAHRLEAFFRCWTGKEAFIKATGGGFSVSLSGFDIDLAAEGPAGVVVHGDPEESTRWSLRRVVPGPGYCAALATEGAPRRVRCWQWSDLGSGAIGDGSAA